jgi:hypothetical protein
MKFRLLTTMIAATVLLGVGGKAASAGQLYQGWNYGIDSFSDGSGGSAFEINAIAMKATENKVFVALTGGIPLVGVHQTDSWTNGGVVGQNNIGWGDLFFNFTGKNFTDANNSNSLIGIRFASNTDSGAPSTGVYEQASAKSITLNNDGYSSLKWYYDAGFNQTNSQGTDLPTPQSVYNYYYGAAVANNPTGFAGSTNFTQINTPILNVINTGTKAGDIALLDASALASAGLNFGHFGATGSQTFGFSFDRSLLGSGNYMANLFVECGNDAVALQGNLEAVPEASGMATFAALGLMGLGVARRRFA